MSDYRFEEIYIDLDLLEEEVNELRRQLREFTQQCVVGLEAQNEACIPVKATVGAAGYDLKALCGMTLPVGEIVKVPTGVRLRIPPGYEAQARSRSGLAARGIIVVNSPGTIDSDYRGEVCVLMQSTKRTHEIKAGDRIAQLVFHQIPEVYFEIVEGLETDTVRGIGGFGSTGE